MNEIQAPLRDCAALGDGRSIVITARDSAISWWCVPDIDSEPLFDRLIDADDGGYFAILPHEPYTVERFAYRDDSNVLETVFRTPTGLARLTESLNSGGAGRLPWSELARQVECLEGRMTFQVTLRFSHRAHAVSPYLQNVGPHLIFNVGSLLGSVLHCEKLVIADRDDNGFDATIAIAVGETATVAIVVGDREPLMIPQLDEIAARLHRSDDAWREWARGLRFDGAFAAELRRSALALKFLLHSPSGAIVAAGTTSLPEKIGGEKNYDYRFAWVRDAGYSIKAFLAIGAKPEADAAFRWLLQCLDRHGASVCFTLDGDRVPEQRELDVTGYCGSLPAVVGNNATLQHQHGVYGDILGTTYTFVQCGGVLDTNSAAVLSALADECADRWQLPDSGIWEIETPRHYTISKISCWEAMARAVELADMGQLPTTHRERWVRARDRIAAWIDDHCWSDAKQAYVCYGGSEDLDASLALAVRFRFEGRRGMRGTLDAIGRELGRGAFHYRYSHAEKEEGCFLACTLWLIEAYARLGDKAKASADLRDFIAALPPSVGILPEMIDPDTKAFLGNLPQGLSHLAMVQAITAIND